jgi:hypothetical protein
MRTMGRNRKRKVTELKIILPASFVAYEKNEVNNGIVGEHILVTGNRQGQSEYITLPLNIT